MPETTDTEPQQQTPEPKQSEFTPITTQDDLDRVVGERLARERAKFADYGDLKAKAQRFDEIEEKNKTELQKLQERAEKAEKERDAERLNLARQQAATKTGLPVEMAMRLQGGNLEELIADAEALAKLITPATRSPKPTGAQSGDTHHSGDWLRNQFAKS